jgi:hypothetical protein
MTVLDVELIGSTIASDMEDVETDTEISVLAETFFILPVSLTVNGKDVFGYRELQTGSYHRKAFLPVLSIVVYWPDALDRLSKEGQAKIFLADAGDMIITLKNGRVKIRTSANPQIEHEEDYSEFDSSLRASTADLVKELKERIPKLFENHDIHLLNL